MTLNKLHKVLGKLIAQGHGRCRVSVDKSSFRDNRESDGVTIIPIWCIDVKWIRDAADDGGLAENKDGSERGRTTVIFGGDCYEIRNANDG